MENMKRVLSYVRRAVDDYGMIEEGDVIAVGVSGGKDSLTLLCALAHLKKFYPKSFEIVPITTGFTIEEVETLDTNNRGGFGSTGKR